MKLTTKDEIKNEDIQAILKKLQRESKKQEDCPDAELVKSVKVKAVKRGTDVVVEETEEDPEWIIETYKRLDISGPLKFQSQICDLDGNRVLDLFYRSKTEYISREHFGKSAVRHQKVSGSWPEKIGVPIPVPIR